MLINFFTQVFVCVGFYYYYYDYSYKRILSAIHSIALHGAASVA